MNFSELSRRNILFTGASTLSFVWPLSACTQSRTKDKKKIILSASDNDIIYSFIERLFPINGLDSAVLSTINDDLFKAAQNDAGLEENLKACIFALQDKSNNDWLKLTPSKQVAIMKEVEGDVWFTGLLLRAKAALFAHPKLWKVLGYGGSSLETGGYKYNGFDDIDWLPGTTQAEPQP